MEDFELNEQIRYERAKKRVRAISGFYKHLAVYILINAFLLALKYFNLDAGEHFWTFKTFSTAFFWGIGLMFHALGVFNNHYLFGREWEERKIRSLMGDKRSEKWE